MNGLIIGYGTVGHNLFEELKKLNLDICDKYKNIEKKEKKHSVGFVCVDTPLVNGKVDCTEVENAINENDCDIYVIKSTVYVGFVEYLKDKAHKRIIFSPEYYGGTQHCNNFEFNFTILGGDKKDCLTIQQFLQGAYDARHTFHIVDSKTAELVKFMENSWLAYKVSFCIDFMETAKKCDVNYEELRELFILDPRVNPSHTFVYDEHPYWDSHCLNKDVPSIANQFDIESLKKIIEINNKRKNKNV